jgi:hypothetical protein
MSLASKDKDMSLILQPPTGVGAAALCISNNSLLSPWRKGKCRLLGESGRNALGKALQHTGRQR